MSRKWILVPCSTRRTNIHFLDIAEGRRQGLQERLAKADVMAGEPHEGRLMLTFNESLLRKPVDAIVQAFAR